MQRSQWQAFYWTTAWHRRRALQLAAEPLCRMCEARGRLTAARVVDHVEPHNGDWNKFRLGALQSLCEQCHNQDKQRLEARGYAADVDDDGWPTDPRHPANKAR